MSSISFDNPYLLLLALPIVALFAVPFFICVRRDNANGHNIASAVIHVVLAILIAFTAAGTKVVTVITETDVYVVCDVSYSSHRNLDTVDGYIDSLEKSLPQNSKLGVICFGKDYKLTSRLGQKRKSVKESGVDDSATDIVGALEYAGTLFADDVVKRIVLITDGRQTQARDRNELRRTVDKLSALGIHIDAIFLDNNIKPGVNEAQISGADYTSRAYLGHTEYVTATVKSNTDAQGVVSLALGAEEISRKAVTLAKGVNTVAFELDTNSPGVFDYRLEVELDGDGNPYDNVFEFTQEVTGNVNVLLISDNPSDEEAVRSAFGGEAKVDAYIGRTDVPCSVEALLAYDQIVLSDYDVSKIDNFDEFAKSLDTAASMFGKSVLAFGDLGLQNTAPTVNLDGINNMMPVRYGRSSSDASLNTIVIDASRSMLTLNKLNYAKRAATQLIDILEDEDDLSVVIFYGEVSKASIMQPIRLSDKERVAQAKQMIQDLGGTQGTYIGLALSAAFDSMRLLPYENKQVMLISDGLNYSAETNDPLEVVRQMYANDIVTSVFDVGRGADTGVTASAAQNLLKNIAAQGAGVYYNPPESMSDVDNIVFGEMANNTKDTIVELDSSVRIESKYDSVLDGLDEITYIGGYVNSNAKASATTVLTTDYYGANGGKTAVPVYSYWKYGNGRVSAFTSSLSGEWIRPWIDGGTYDGFFRNLFFTNLPAEQKNYPFMIERFTDVGATELVITPAVVYSDAEVTVNVVSPSGDTDEYAANFDSAAFTAEFPTDGIGKYGITVTYKYGGYTYTADAGFILSYLPEYDGFASYEASSLHRSIGDKGTVSEDGRLSLENDENEVGTKTVSLAVPLLIACAVLFFADVVVRKLKWIDIKNLFVKVDKKRKDD